MMNMTQNLERSPGTLGVPFRGTMSGTGTAETRASIGLALERHTERCPMSPLERSTTPLGLERWNGEAISPLAPLCLIHKKRGSK